MLHGDGDSRASLSSDRDTAVVPSCKHRLIVVLGSWAHTEMLVQGGL